MSKMLANKGVCSICGVGKITHWGKTGYCQLCWGKIRGFISRLRNEYKKGVAK